MNTRPTETRTAHDVRLQRELEALLAAKRAEAAAREARYRRLRTPRSQFRADAKAPMADFRRVPEAPTPKAPDDSPMLKMCLEVLASLVLWALFGYGVIAAIAWVLS